MKLLLGATVALLLAAIAWSWKDMHTSVGNSPDELQRLQRKVAELEEQHDKLQLEKQIQQLKATTPDAPAAPANPQELEVLRAQLDANKAALAQLESEKAERDAKLAKDEQLLMEGKAVENRDGELRRARLIADALLIGKVKEYVQDAEFGGFITFDVLMPDQVQPGSTVLAIRRNNGILSQFKVTEVTAEGGIANPLPGFGPVEPQVGDELILPPQF